MKIILIYSQSSALEMFRAFASSYGHDLLCASDPGQARKLLADDAKQDLVVFEIPHDLKPWQTLISTDTTMASDWVLLGLSSEKEPSQIMNLHGQAYVSPSVQPEVLNWTLQAAARNKRNSAAFKSALDEITRLQSELETSREQKKDAIAEKDLTYRELLSAYSKLQDLNQQRTDFLLTATHELRTPVTVMKGYHTILLDGRLGELSPQQKEVLSESEQSCNRLIKIINSLLDLSRIEAGKLEIIYQECDLATNLKSVIEKLKDLAERKRVAIALEADDSLPLVRCDRDKINRALTNLLEDVIKFAPAKGKICITARYHGPDKATLLLPRESGGNSEDSDNSADSGFHPLGPSVLIRISDTAGTASARLKQDVTESLNSTSANQKDRAGLGLGLTVTKRIIQAHGGKIWLDSEPNSGSRFFSLLLPLNSVEAKVAKTIES